MGNDSSVRSGARIAVAIARVFIALSIIAVIFAWISEFTGGEVLGFTQQHLFSDAAVLALLGIAVFVDAFWHAKHV